MYEDTIMGPDSTDSQTHEEADTQFENALIYMLLTGIADHYVS